MADPALEDLQLQVLRKRVADKRAMQPPPQEVLPTEGESALRGIAQGASLGFADEITGGGEAVKDTLTGKSKLKDFNLTSLSSGLK